MSRLIINNFNEFAQHIGQELGVSDYLTITQEQIDLFADATLDHQWIHVDTERARTESPYKSTIAHGYLNLSVLPYLWGRPSMRRSCFSIISNSAKRIVN